MGTASSGGRCDLPRLLGLPYGEVWNRLNEYVKEALKRIGAEVTTLSVTTLSDPALGVARTYVTTSIRHGILFGSHSDYSNPKMDELFAKA
jgi:peptide/nickel transport system substrate-binding protein